MQVMHQLSSQKILVRDDQASADRTQQHDVQQRCEETLVLYILASPGYLQV